MSGRDKGTHVESMQSVAAAPSYGTSDHYTGEKGAEYFAWQSAGGEFGARINAHKFQHLIKPTDTVIDFGCGGGFLLNAIPCARRIGVEINPVAREYARAHGVECHGRTEDVADGLADIVVSDHALEHVPFPIGALQELRRKLKATGTLSICVPIDNWRRQRVFNPNDRNHHLHTWTPQLLANTLREAGFEIVDVRARVFAWPGRWTVATYGRLPFWAFTAICYSYGTLTGQGWEVLATCRPVRA